MTTTYARERTLQDEIAPAVERGVPGIEVLAVELLSPSRFCVYVDHPDGVDHALCARVTQLLGAYRADFTIDVSSPGPERPLRKPGHFASAVGRRVAVRTGSRIGGRDRFKGELVEAGDGAVTLATTTATDPLRIPYEAIVRANLIDEG
ncbi:MAG: ribosome maturation factor RimP [Gaiellaceae bacterium]